MFPFQREKARIDILNTRFTQLVIPPEVNMCSFR